MRRTERIRQGAPRARPLWATLRCGKPLRGGAVARVGHQLIRVEKIASRSSSRLSAPRQPQYLPPAPSSAVPAIPPRAPGAQSCSQLEQRSLAFPQHHPIERSELEHEPGIEGRFMPPAMIMAEARCASPGAQARGRTAASSPWWRCRSHPRMLRSRRSSALCGVPVQELGSKTSARLLRPQHSGEPHTPARREEGVLAAMRVIGPDQKDVRRAGCRFFHTRSCAQTPRARRRRIPQRGAGART